MGRDRIMNPSPFPVQQSGNVVNTPFVIRGSVTTAYLALTTGTKTSFLAGNSSYFLDLVQISLANNSSVAVTDIELADESTTVQKFSVGLNNSITVTFPVPIQQGSKGTAWYLDMGDITGTTITAQALFIQRAS